MPPNRRNDARCAVAVAAALTIAVALVPLGCGGSGDPSAAAPHSSTVPSVSASAPSRSLTTGFEDGSLRLLTDHTRARVARAAAKHGSFGLEVDAAGGDAFALWNAPTDGTARSWWSFRAWIRVVSWSRAEAVDLFTVRNTRITNNFDVFVDTPTASTAGSTKPGGTRARRVLRWDLYRGDTARSRGRVELGRWYLVEANGSFATDTYTAEVRIDGVAQRPITSDGQPPAAVRDVYLGPGGAAKTQRVQYDDVKIEVADRPLERIGPPEPRS